MVAIFPFQASMSLTKLPVAGLVSDVQAGGGKIDNLFFSVMTSILRLRVCQEANE
jgi:hypothetical protein